MLFARAYTLCLLMLFSEYLYAAQNSPAKDNTNEWRENIQMPINKDASAELRLIARQTPLALALNEITQKTRVLIHYSTLPEDRVTAGCTGKVKAVMACLLGANVDMVFRYASGPSTDKVKTQPVEVWILPVTALLNQAQQGVAAADNSMATKQGLRKIAGQENTDITEILLEQAKDPLLRMEAIASLAVAGRKDDLNVRNTLKAALTDKNAGVRAQAVFALARREGDGAVAELRQAMRDKNAEVRLMALESAGNDPVMLQQALNDSNKNVRQFAATKLTTMNKVNQGIDGF